MVEQAWVQRPGEKRSSEGRWMAMAIVHSVEVMVAKAKYASSAEPLWLSKASVTGRWGRRGVRIANRSSIEETGHQLKGHAKVSNNRVVRDSLGAVITNKVLPALTQCTCNWRLKMGGWRVKTRPKNQKGSQRKSPLKKKLPKKKRRDFDNCMKGNLISN